MIGAATSVNPTRGEQVTAAPTIIFPMVARIITPEGVPNRWRFILPKALFAPLSQACIHLEPLVRLQQPKRSEVVLAGRPFFMAAVPDAAACCSFAS